MFRFLYFSVFFLFSISLSASSEKIYTSEKGNFKIKIVHNNPSDDIKDSKIVVSYINSQISDSQKQPVLKYNWSFKSLSENDTLKEGATEGIDYKLIVTDTNGDILTVSSQIIPESNSEKINAFMTPIVGAIEDVFFWDPFSFIGIYDPVLKDKAGEALLHPNGEIRKQHIPFLVIWLVFGAIFFTIRTKVINIRGLRYSIGLLRGEHDHGKDKGEVSHFQALTTALSATVGLGNIAGVSIAVVAGGPGAMFWMVVAGFLGMASKFVECTLGVKYRVIKNGIVSGGPMYYLSEGLKKDKLGGLGKLLAVVFAVLCVGGSFGGGNMFQSNQAFAQIQLKFPEYESGGFYFGIILAVLVGIVIVGGIKKIAKVTDKIVPFMCGLYVLFCLIVIGTNISEIDEAIYKIFEGAFTSNALKGGIIGVLVQGFQRAAFSNEAGIGSASIAHSAVKTDKPISEGLVALLEPLIDTVIICSLTALVLIFTGYEDGGLTAATGAELTTLAFESVIPYSSWILLVAILLFAFSTMISWSYYGLKAWEFLFGYSNLAGYTYKIMFLIFVVIGASIDLGAVIAFSDLMILGMAFPNIIGLLILLPEVRKDLAAYIDDLKVNKSDG